MMRTALLVFSLLASVAAALANPAETTEALDIGSRLELFVDDYLIDRLVGARLALGHPQPAGIVRGVTSSRRSPSRTAWSSCSIPGLPATRPTARATSR